MVVGDMWAYPLAPPEGKRLWGLTSTTVLVWGVLVGPWIPGAAADPLSGKAAGERATHSYRPGPAEEDSRSLLGITGHSVGLAWASVAKTHNTHTYPLLKERGLLNEGKKTPFRVLIQ